MSGDHEFLGRYPAGDFETQQDTGDNDISEDMCDEVDTCILTI